jgi:hypothetical protein
MKRMARLTSVVCAIVLAGTVGVRAQDTSKADAARMKTKLTAIAERGSTPPKTGQPPLTTTFTDRELNAYFKIDGPDVLPPGLENPQVTIEDASRVRGRAILDLDVVLKTRERSMFDPLAWLTGKTEITTVGLVRGAGGKGTVQIEGVTLGGITVPITLLQQIVNYYTRTPERPAGIDITKPFDLPAGIQSITSRRGQATFVQP